MLMKTDHPIYLFLSAGAEAFRVLTGGIRLEGWRASRRIPIWRYSRRY